MFCHCTFLGLHHLRGCTVFNDKTVLICSSDYTSGDLYQFNVDEETMSSISLNQIRMERGCLFVEHLTGQQIIIVDDNDDKLVELNGADNTLVDIKSRDINH